MRVALTVAPGRYTPADEVARLLDPIEAALVAVGAEPVRWLPPALPWLEWLEWRHRPIPTLPRGADLLAGFDLPEGAKRATPRWADLREHPCHFAGDYWSVTDSAGPLDDAALAVAGMAELVADLPPQARLAESTSLGAFACQVSFDTALMRDGHLIRPADVLEGLRAFAHRFEVLYVAPSPREPGGPWVDAALSIANAVLSPWPTYELLARVRDVCTVTSSVGVEAEYFGCRTTWLSAPRQPGAPLRDLADPRLWALLLQRAGPVAV